MTDGASEVGASEVGPSEVGASEVGAATTWRSLRDEARRRLTVAGIAAAGSEARWMVEDACGLDETELDRPALVRQAAHLDAMVARRLAGEPIQYVLGHWSFRTLDLLVDSRVLIPRPETEVVAGLALGELRRVGSESPVAVDLGTGSGAIGLSLAAEHQGVLVWAGDVAPEAVAVARANTAALGRPGARVTLVEGSWFDALPEHLRGAIDVLVSNPPYVAEIEDLPDEVADWEPTGALRAGPAGLDDLAMLIEGAVEWLRPGGLVLLEHAPQQADALLRLAERHGLESVVDHADLTGRPRVFSARRPRPV